MVLLELVNYMGQETSGLVGAALGGFFMFLAHKGWDVYKAYRKRKALDIIPRLLDADLAVYQTLSQLQLETGADRAYVMQFHNGVYYLNQANHMKVSCTHEIVKDGIARIQDTMQDLLLSKFAAPLAEVLREGVSVFDADEQAESYYKSMIKSQGTAKSVAAIMMDGNVVEGSIVINYLEGSEILKLQDFEVVKQKVTEAAETIGFKLRGKH